MTSGFFLRRLDVLPAVGNRAPVVFQAVLMDRVAAAEEDHILLLSVFQLPHQALPARTAICTSAESQTHGSIDLELFQKMLVFFDCDRVDNPILLFLVFVCMQKDVQARLHLTQRVVLVLLKELVHSSILHIVMPVLCNPTGSISEIMSQQTEKEKAIFFILVLANSLLYVSNSSSVISKRRAVEMITSAEGSFGFE